MYTETETMVRTFISVSEVWVPDGDKLILGAGNYGALDEFAQASRHESFTKGEGLPGKAWADAKPVVLKTMDGSYFKRMDAAREAGLTSGVAIPVFDGDALKAVLVVLCSDDSVRMGAIEVWADEDGLMTLDDGYYGAAQHFEWVSKHIQFPIGQGLPGGVRAANTPMLFRDLGSGYRFVRAESAGKAGLTTGLGMPVPVPDGGYVLTLLSARGTPIARRFEIWDARSSKVGTNNAAMLIDGICEREGALWNDENPRKLYAWRGVVGRALGTGVPEVSSSSADAAGYDSVVAVPIHQAGELSHVIAWYC